MTIRRLLLTLSLSFVLAGCGSGGLFGVSVTADKAKTEPPNTVHVFITVNDGSDPVDSLSESNFKLYENDLLLDNRAVRLHLLPTDSMAAGLTILLLDLSGSPDEAELNRIERGATHFVEKVTVTQPVTVVAFDGSARPREVARFSKVEQATERAVPSLEPFLSQDSSRDLNSAIVSAIKGATAELKKRKSNTHFGTIVTLLRGPDLAGRTSDKDAQNAIYESGFEFYSLSPEGTKIGNLADIGKNKRFAFATFDTMPMTFQDVGARVRSAWNSHYLLNYCSPSRAGERKLKIAVEYEGEGGGKKKGSARSGFDSTGFVGGCGTQAAEPALSENPPTGSTANEVNTGKKPQKAAPLAGPIEETEEVVAPPSSGKYE